MRQEMNKQQQKKISSKGWQPRSGVPLRYQYRCYLCKQKYSLLRKHLRVIDRGYGLGNEKGLCLTCNEIRNNQKQREIRKNKG